jgi:putative flippase GtrA
MIPGLANHQTTNREQRTTIDKYKKEFWKLIKFGIVGASTFLFQLILYIIFTRMLMPDLPRVLIYSLALGLAMTENYTAHRLWTFNDQIIPKQSALRYSLIVITAAIVNAGIFYFGHHVIHIYDLKVVLFAGLVVPFITYAGHRWFSFRR